MLLHLDSIKADPLGFLIELLYTIPAVVCALVLHELGHGYVALRCGDPTAQMMGRLSFNPLAHLDPLGTASMFLLGIGWAKPVPVDPRNFKNPRRDDLLVSAAGITVNLFLFILGTILSLVCVRVLCSNDILQELQPLAKRNGIDNSAAFLMKFSLADPELLQELLKMLNQYGVINQPWLIFLFRFFGVSCRLNMSLAIFNLLPIPPLDGYRIVDNLVFKGRWKINPQVLRISVIVLLIINFATNWLGNALFYAANGVQSALLWIFLPLFGMA